MISILCESGTEARGREIAELLRGGHEPGAAPEVVDGQTPWNRPPEWDDLLLVPFLTPELSPAGRAYLEAFRQGHRSGAPDGGGSIVPVALDPARRKPPDPIAGLKSLVYDGGDAGRTALVRAVGVFLGLALRPGDHGVFVSYRMSDGQEVAQDLHQRLTAAGFKAWLDEAEGNLAAGDDVQAKIRAQLAQAALLLVVDTRDAPESPWIDEEIHLAIGQLIPIVPVLVGPFAPGEDVSRISTLRQLQRRVVVKAQDPARGPVSEGDWDRVRSEVEEILLGGYRRRKLLMKRAEAAFQEAGFRWSALDDRRRMYQAERGEFPDPVTVVLSHCAVHDVTFPPALQAYREYLTGYAGIAEVSHKLCLYDRDKPISRTELLQVARLAGKLPFMMAHLNELALLVRSNFAGRGS